MGCGSSIEHSKATSSSLKQKKLNKKKKVQKVRTEQLMGKDIPRIMVTSHEAIKLPQQIEIDDNSDDETFKNLKSLLNPKKDKKLKRLEKRTVRQFQIDDTDTQIKENFKKVHRDKGTSDHQLIYESFKSHYVLYNLAAQSIEHTMKMIFYGELEAGQYLFKMGDKVPTQYLFKASCYFVIERGEVEILVGDKSVKILGPGQPFGELALLYNAPRSASVRAVTNCGFWILDRHSFRQSIEEINAKVFYENRLFMDEVQFFYSMTPTQRDAIAQTILTTKYKKGDFIVIEGDHADSYYVIKSGTVSVLKDATEVRQMGPKDSFGEQALYVSSVRMASVVALTEVECLALSRDNLTKILGDKVQQIIFNNQIKWSFEKSAVLNKLTNLQRERIVLNAKISNVRERQILFSTGQTCDQIVVVLEGQGVTSKGEEFAKGTLIGDTYLLSQNANHPLECFYTMQTDGVIASVQFEFIRFLMGGDFEVGLKKIENSHEIQIQKIRKREKAQPVEFNNLLFLKLLGQGQFGTVYLVADACDDNKLYALKCIQKHQIATQHLDKQMTQEKIALENMNFPFIMQFQQTFKDEYSVYMLTEYVSGLELFDVIREIGLLSKSTSQFYIGSLILMLEYMHSMSLIYRDLKPENVMVNEHGYLTLIDFGSAKLMGSQTNKRTKTIIGTPHYMAPEIIIGQSYSSAVDLWSLGVCMYEFISGGVPFGEDVEDPYNIYEEIISKSLQFPTYIRDRQVRKLNEQLLSITPEARLGSSYSQLKANHYFDDLDWDRLYAKDLKAPYRIQKEKLLAKESIDTMIKQKKLIQTELKKQYHKLEKMVLEVDAYF